MYLFIKRNWKTLLFAVLIVILLVVFVFNKKEEVLTTHVVSREDVLDVLVLSGKVEPLDKVEMAFTVNGVVDRVLKQNGDVVKSGEKIVELDNTTLYAEIAQVTASSSAKEQDLLVDNTYKKLLNGDLTAYLVSSEDDDLSAVISGTYNKQKEGVYRLDIYGSVANSGLSIRYSGLEEGAVPLTYNSPAPIGNSGLFIKFNNNGTSYNRTSWVIEIPNKRGPNYVANLSAYESAKKTRDVSLAEVDARVAGINAQISERILRAPFDGVISRIDVKKGEIASAGKVVVTVSSKDKYRVKVQVPEIDIVNLVPGLLAEIKLDAYGDDILFLAKVNSVDRFETKVDGVSVYETEVLFDDVDPKIISGLSAEVSILKDKKENVLCVPNRFIKKDDDGEFVMIRDTVNNKNNKRIVVTGLRGVNGCVEILSGVGEGDVVVEDFKK